MAKVRDYPRTTADRLAHQAPNPIKVAQITASHGADAAAARWYWVPAWSLHHIACEGRRLLNARAGVIVRTVRRPTSPEQESVIVEEVLAGASVRRTGMNHGISECLVKAILQERGILDWPAMRRKKTLLEDGRRS